MNREILKGFVCCGAIVLTISACASVKNFAGFFGILNTNKEQGRGETLTTFAGTIRPVQGNPDSHYYLARYYQERGNHGEAIKEFEKTLAIDPENAKALNAMGVSYDFLKEFRHASDCYQAALKLDPNSANIYYNNIGQSLLLQGKYTEAIEAFKKAAAYDEDFPAARVHNNLGRAYTMAGQHDLALAEFTLSNGNISAEAILDRSPLPTSGTASVNAGNETNAFAAGVSKFLQDRRVVSNVLKEIATPAKAPQIKPAPGAATDFCVEVPNGNGVKFSARDTRDYLTKKGFHVTSVNEGLRVAQTYIYYKDGYEKEAEVLARQIPVAAKIKKVPRLNQPGVEVKLIVGRDMAQYMNNPLKKSADAVLERVINPTPGVAVVKAEDGTKAFTTVVSKFLQARRFVSNVLKEIATPTKTPQIQPALGAAADFCVEVSNGNGVKFSARNTRDYLTKKGFRVTRVNDGVNVARTYIYYKDGYKKEAEVLARQIPVVAKIKKVSRLDEPRIKVRLLVGKDMVRYVRSPSKKSYTLNSWSGA